MQSFEYTCVAIWGWGASTKRALDVLGRDGWELVCVWAIWHYLKRPVAAD